LTKSFNFQFRLFRIQNIEQHMDRQPYNWSKIEQFLRNKPVELVVDEFNDNDILKRVCKHILKEREQIEAKEMIKMIKILSDYNNV